MARPYTQSLYYSIAAAWLLFVISFLLPATNIAQRAGTDPGTPLTGWQTFCSSVFSAANPLIWIAEPGVMLFLIFPFANALMFHAPLLVLILRERSALIALLLVPCAVVPWFLPKVLLGDLFVGFYCWNVSYFAMSACCIYAPYAYWAEDQTAA